MVRVQTCTGGTLEDFEENTDMTRVTVEVPQVCRVEDRAQRAGVGGGPLGR